MNYANLTKDELLHYCSIKENLSELETILYKFLLVADDEISELQNTLDRVEEELFNNIDKLAEQEYLT